ncbi:hypothetical protein HP550_08485 [Cellulomonas humilata]|uniref:Uncharacterized protein n=1 Tax=Cellulomonas humilata TaxID=144055 RepID=A0A7Y6DXQ4_9CELL|nr:hypothetical protein [Cellulomonas humilata]NUU17287.1 hypothetical protein [Cellulomonas humilata]
MADLLGLKEGKYYYALGCEILGDPPGGYWRPSLADRQARMSAGKREAKRRERNPAPSRADGNYSRSRADGGIDVFIGPDGGITSERPHVHVVHSAPEDRIIFTVTQRDGTHTHTEYLLRRCKR